MALNDDVTYFYHELELSSNFLASSVINLKGPKHTNIPTKQVDTSQILWQPLS